MSAILPNSSADVFAQTSFDVIVIGAGTAGLPIAARHVLSISEMF
jgi:ribulose 1,5-bisphosphate synthetase/thiazole synthase